MAKLRRIATFGVFGATLAFALAASAQPRTPLACPGPLAPLALSSGTWLITGVCSVAGVHLTGTADVLITGSSFLIQDDLLLEDDSMLHVLTTNFVIAQQSTAQIHSQTRDRATLFVENARVTTNAALNANITAFVDAYGDSQVHFKWCALDTRYNWVLVYLHERSTLIVENSVEVPTENYPRDDSTVRVTGTNTRTRVVLLMPPDSSAELDDIPAGETFTYQFGRGTPGNAGIGYLVDVQNSFVRWGVSSGPRSNIAIRNNGQPLTLSYLFALVTQPTLLAGVRPVGPLTQQFNHLERSLVLDDVLLFPNGWQVYVESLTAPSNVKPVWIEDSQLNEMGALRNGIVEVRESVFQYAFLAAYSAGSRVRVEDSVINSQNVRANEDGVLEIFDSTIWGSLLDAGGASRIRLSNTELNDNVCHPGCLPSCISFTGGNECNAFNPALHVGFNVRGGAAVLGARLAPIAAPVPSGTPLAFVGDAYVESPVAALAASSWELSIRPLAGGAATVVASGGGVPLRGALLGTLDTATVASGEYVARLELRPPGEPVLAAERFFVVQAQ